MNEIPVTVDELAGLIDRARTRLGRRGRRSQGEGEWANWYAAELQGPLAERLGWQPRHGDLAYALAAADQAFAPSGHDEAAWPRFAAEFLRNVLASTP